MVFWALILYHLSEWYQYRIGEDHENLKSNS